MSTILKALRRLEEDRTSQSRRPLREEVASGGAGAAPRRRGRWLVLAGLALCVGSGAGALAFWSVTRDESPAGTETAATQPVAPPSRTERLAKLEADRETARRQAAARRAARATDSEAAPSGLPAEAFQSPVERLERPAAEPRIAPPDEGEAAPALAARPTPVRPDPAMLPGRHKRELPARAEIVPEVPDASAVARAPAAAAPPAPAPQAAPEPAPIASAAAPSPPAREPVLDEEQSAPASDTFEPELEAPPERVVARAASPSLRVQRTSWHPLAERRSALVEVDDIVQEVHEGDAVGSWVVATIEPSGVVFLRNGTEVRRRVGER